MICITCEKDKDIEEFSIAYGSYRRLHCKLCMADKQKATYNSDSVARQRRLDNNLSYFYRSKDAVLRQQKERRDEDPEIDRERSRKYRKDHPEVIRERGRANKARRRGAQVRERVDRWVVWDRDKGVCQLCLLPADPNYWHLDHILPIIKGGEHSYANTQVTHPICNLRKGSHVTEQTHLSTPEVWAQVAEAGKA